MYALEKYNRDCESSCTAVAIDFSNYLDRDDDRMFDIITDDFVIEHCLTHDGEPIRSYDVAEMRAILPTRPAPYTSRHFRTNIQITRTDDTSASGLSNCLALFTKGQLGNGPLSMPKTPIPHVYEYNETFVLTEGGWRLSKRRTIEIFQDIPMGEMMGLLLQKAPE